MQKGMQVDQRYPFVSNQYTFLSEVIMMGIEQYNDLNVFDEYPFDK